MVDIRPPGKIAFDLVSPERLLLSRAVDMVVAPGSEGLFGVLIGHAPLIALLKPGVIDVYDDNRVTDRIFVGGGFCEVTPERCTVLAETATPVGELDRAAIAAEIARLTAAGAGPVMSAEIGADGVWPPLLVQRAMLAAADSQPL